MRAEEGWLITGLLAVINLAVVLTAPPQKIHKCAAYCKENEKTNTYSPGSSYVYSYTAETDTYVSGVEGSNDVSRLRLTATASVHVIAPCEYVLELSDVSFSSPGLAMDSATSVKVSEALTAEPLSFSMHRGAVGALCPEPGDARNVWVLNFKRGLLSALQTGKGDMRQSHVSHERDVAGDCFTRFHIEPTHDDLLTVRRFKDLTQCSSRKKTIFSLPSSHYGTGNSKALILSQHNCTQTLDSQRLVSASCYEKHKLEPFSNGQAGARTIVRQTLVLRKELKTQRVPKISASIDERTTLLYQETASEMEKVPKEQVFKVLQNLEDATSKGVEEQATVLFANLVSILKTLDQSDLIYIIENTSQSQRYMILDAMQLIQTDENVSTMLKLLQNGILTEGQFNSWLSSLSFNNNPSLLSIQQLTPLLVQANKNAILSISSMIYRYCQSNEKCLKDDIIVKALRSIEYHLGEGCEMTSARTQDDILLALKGLGNAGVTNAREVLLKCHKMNALPIEIRLQALSAYRRFSCDMLESQSFFEILGNKTESTEIRIAAYIAAMQCPSYKSLYKIRGVLLNEKVNQVGSFIWTHLTNIQESSARWKNDIKYILSSEKLRKKFDTNFRKYSRNYEFSSFSDSLNAGGAVESNVIFTPESYIPRSAMLNLTLDIFGETVNILELGGRADGLEDTVEKMFSPDGYFPDETLSKIIYGLKTDESATEIDALMPKNENKRIQVPKGTMYARIFGNELNYFNFNNLEDLSSTGDIFQDMLSSLFQGKDIDFVKSFSIVDAVYSVPTIIGFPLNLALNATGTAGLKIGGKVDVKNLRDFKIDIAGHIVPSAAFRVVGTMLVDAFVTKSGLKFDASMNSNSYVDGSMKVDGGKLVDVKIKVPKERMDLVKISSELYLINPAGHVRIAGHPHRERFQSCGSRTVAAITGMQLCTDISYPNASTSVTAPYFPLTGPSRYVLDLKKIDNFDAYEFKYQLESKIVSNEPVHVFNLHLDTPNSSINRKIDIGYVIYPKAMNASARFHTPLKRYDFNGKIVNSASFKAIEGEILSDGKRAVGLKGSISTQDDKVSSNINIQYFDRLISEVDGFVAYTRKNKYSTFISLSGFTKEKVTFLGDLNKDNDKWEWTGKFTNPELTGDMQGVLSFKQSMYSIKNSMNYKFANQPEQKISLNMKYENIVAGMLKKLGVAFSLQSTEFPQSNAEFAWGFQKTPGYIDHLAVAGIGNVIWKTHQLYRLKSLDGYYDFEAKCAFNCINKNIDYAVSMKYLTNFKGVSAHGLAHLNDQQRVYAKVEFLKEPGSDNIKVSLECSLPKHRWMLNGHLTRVLNEYNVLFTGSAIRSGAVEEETNFKAVGSYVDLSDAIKRYHALTLHFTHTTEDMRQTGPWTLKGKLMVSDKRFECSVSSDYEENKYAAQLLYVRSDLHRITLVMDLADRHYENALEFDLDGPYKRLMLDLDLEKRIFISLDYNASELYRQDIDLLLYWDKNNNPENKCSMSFVNSQGQQTFRLDYPGQSIIGISSFEANKFKIFVHWNENQFISFEGLHEEIMDKVAIELQMKMKILELEEQSIELSYYGLRQQAVETHMHVKWLNNSVLLDAFGNYSSLPNLTALMTIKSSYDPVPNITLDLENILEHEINSLSSTTAFKLIYNEKKYLLSGNYTINDGFSNAEYALTGPDVVISKALFQYSTSKELTNISGKLSWFDKELFAKYEQKPQQGDFILKTPFKYLEQNAFSYFYDFQHYRSNFKTQVQLLGEDFYLQSSIEHPNIHTIAGTINMTATFLPKANIDFKHNFLGSIIEKIKILYGEQDKCLLDLELRSDRAKHITFNLLIPDHIWELSLVRDNHDGHNNWHFKYLWNDDNLVATLLVPNKAPNFYNTEHVRDFYLFEVTGNLIKHRSALELEFIGEMNRILLEISHGDSYNLRDSFDYNKITYISKNTLTVTIGTEEGEISSTNDLHFDKFHHKTVLRYNDWRDEIQASYSIEENLLRKAFIKWQRPEKDSNLNDNSFIFDYSLKSDEDVIEPELTISDKKFKENIEIKGKILKRDQSQIILLSAKSSKFEAVDVELSYDLQQNIKTSELIATWGERTIKLSADAALDATSVMANFVVNLSDMELSRINFSYDMSTNELKCAMILKQRDTYQVTSRYVLQPGVIRLLGNIETPLEDWKRLELDVDILSEIENKHANIIIVKNSEALEFLSYNEHTENTFDIDVTLRDTLFSLPKINLKLKKEDSLFVVDTLVKYSGVEMNFNTKLQYWKNKLIFYGVLITDLTFPNAHMDIAYDFTGTNNTFGLNLGLNQQFVVLNGTSLAHNEDTDIFINLSVGLLDYVENVSVSVKQTNDENHSLHIILTRMGSQFEISANAIRETENILYTFAAKTPILNWENVIGQIFLIRKEQAYSAGITGEINDNIIKITSDVNFQGTVYCKANVNFVSFIENYENVNAGFTYDLRKETKFAKIFIHPSADIHDHHELEAILNANIEQLKVSFGAKSPLISNKSIIIRMDYDFNKAGRFFNSILGLRQNNDSLIEGEIFSFKAETELKDCDICIGQILISARVQQFSNETHYILFNTKIKSDEYKLLAYYTDGDVMDLDLIVYTPLERYEKTRLKAAVARNYAKASLQWNTDNEITLAFDMDLLFSNEPILQVHMLDLEMIVLTIGQMNSYLKINTIYDIYTSHISYDGSDSTYLVSFNATNNGNFFVAGNTLFERINEDIFKLNFELNNTITNESYRNLFGEISCDVLANPIYDVNLTLSTSDFKIIDFHGSINDIRSLGFTIEYKLETTFRSSQESSLIIRFYPDDIDVFGKLSFRDDYTSQSLQGQIALSPNGDQGDIKVVYLHKQEQYVHFNWKFDNDNIEAALDTSHSDVKDLNLRLHRDVGSTESYYTAHISGSDSVLESTLKMSIDPANYEYGQIRFQIATPLTTLSSFEIDMRYHMKQNLLIDVECNQKIYNFKIELFEADKSLKLNTIFNTQNPTNNIFKISTELRYAHLEDSFGSLIVSLFNKYRCNIKYEINLKELSGNAKFISKIQDLNLRAEGAYDVTNADNKQANLKIDFLDRIYKVNTIISTHNGSVTILDYFKSKLVDKRSISWYTKKTNDEQRIGIEYALNKQMDTYVIAIQPKQNGMQVSLILNIDEVQSSVKIGWNSETNKNLGSLSADLINGLIVMRSNIENNQKNFSTTFDLQTHFRDPKNISFSKTIYYDEEYLLEASLAWTSQHRIDFANLKAKIAPTTTNLNADVLIETSISAPLSLQMHYDMVSPTKSIIMDIKTKDSSIMKFSTLLNSTALGADLELHIEGFSNFAVLLYHRDFNNGYLKYSSGEQITEIAGDLKRNDHILNGTFNLKTLRGKGPNFDIVINVDEKNLKGTALSHWNDKKNVDLEMHLKPDDLYLKLETPFKNIKSIKIAGAYNIIKDKYYNLRTQGHWNDNKIYLDGTIKANKNEHILIQMHANLSDIFVVLHSNNTMSKDLLDLKFNTESSYKSLDKLALHINSQRSQEVLTASSIFVNVPVDKAWNMYVKFDQTFSDLNKNRSIRIHGNGLGLNFSMNSSIFIDTVIGQYELQNYIDLPIFLEEPVNLKLDLTNNDPKKVELNLVFEYSHSYELSALLDANNNKLSVTLRNNELLNKQLLLEIDGSYEQKGLQFHTIYMDNVFNGSYTLQDDVLTSDVFINIPRSNLLSKSSLLADLNRKRNKIFVELNSEINDHKYSNVINFWKNEGQLQLDITIPQKNKNSPSKHNIKILLKGPKYTIQYDVHSKPIILFQLHEKMNSLYFKYMDKILLDAYIEKDNGKGVFKYNGLTHEYLYKKDSHVYYIQIQSPFLSSKILKAEIGVQNSPTNSFLKIMLSSGNKIFTGHLDMKVESSTRSFILSMSMDDINITHITEYQIIDEHSFNLESALNIMNKNTKLTVVKASNVKLSFLIESDYLQDKEFAAGVMREGASSVAYVRSGDFEMDNFIRATSYINIYEGRVELTAEMPASQYLKKYHLNATVWTEREWMTLDIESSLSSNIWGENMIQGVFNLTKDHFKTTCSIDTNFDIHRNIQCKLITPFKFSNFFTPIISFKDIVGNTEYVLYLSYINIPELLHVGGGVKMATTKFMGVVTVKSDPTPILELSIDTPVDCFRKVRVYFNTYTEDLDGHFVSNYLILNDYKLELRYALTYKVNHVSTYIYLTTPFEKYDKYSIEFDYINLERKVLKAKVYYPLLLEPIGVELVHLIKGFGNTNILVHYNIPLIKSFKKFNAVVKSEIFQLNYIGEISIQNDAFKFGISSNNMLTENSVHSNIVLFLPYDEINILMKASNADNKQIFLKVKSVQKIRVIEILQFELETDANINNIELGLYLHNKQYIAAKLMLTDTSATFETNNIWRSILLSYTYEMQATHKDLQCTICWDLTNKYESQVAAKYKTSTNGIESYIKIPNRQLFFDFNQEVQVSDIESGDNRLELSGAAKFSWNKNESFGFQIMSENFINLEKAQMDRNFSMSLESGSRTLKYSSMMKIYNITLDDFEMVNVDTLFWDESKNPHKNITLYSFIGTDKMQAGILHPALNHKLETRLTRSKKYPNQEKPSALQLEFEYSTDPRDLFVVDYYHVESIDEGKSFESGLELRHLSSHIRHGYSLNVTITEELTQYFLNLKYNNPSEKNLKHIQLLGKIHRTKPVVEGFIENDLNKLSGVFSTWSKDNVRGLTMQTVSNFNLPLIFKASLNPSRSDPSLDFNIVAGPSKSYNIHAAIPSNKEIMAYLEHDLYGSLSKDASFDLRLNTSTLLWTKIYWKTGIWKEIRDNILNEYDDLQYIAENIGQSFVDLVPHNVSGKLFKEIADIKNNVTNYMQSEWILAKQDYSHILDIFQNIYNDNSFYIDAVTIQIQKCIYLLKASPLRGLFDIIEYASAIYDKIISIQYYELFTCDFKSAIQTMTVRVSTLRNDFTNMKTYLKSSITQNIHKVKLTITSLESRMNNLLDEFEEIWRANKMKIVGFLEPYLKTISNFKRRFQEFFVNIESTINGWNEDIKTYIYSIQEFRVIISKALKAWSYIKELSSDYTLDTTLEEITKACDTVLNDARRVFEEYKLYYDAAIDAFIGNHIILYNMTEMSNIQKETNKVVQKIIWMWNYYDAPAQLRQLLQYIEDNLLSLVDQSYNFVIEEVLNKMENNDTELMKKILVGDGSKKIIFRPSNGHIELMHKLPVEWEGFNETPKFHNTNLNQKLVQLKNAYKSFHLETYALWLYAKLISSMSLSQEPPTMYAMIVGSGNYRTFDGKYFNLRGDCKYLLLADADDNDFGIFVDYKMVNGQPIKNSLIVSINTDTIQINTEGRVTINSLPQDLPFAIDAITVHRDHSTIKLQYRHKYFLEWNVQTDITVFQIKQWNRGKTLGLLGKADEESYNDYSLSNGTVVQNLSEFLENWMVRSDNCSGLLNSKADDTESSDLIKLLEGKVLEEASCKKVLGSSESALAGCYSIVDYLPFYLMCMNDRNPCLAAHAYRKMCDIRGATEIAIPDKCVMCQHGEQYIAPGEEMLSTPKVNAADVVFVVEEVNALSLIDLPGLLISLEKALIEQNLGNSTNAEDIALSSNRYSVVGWGGEFGTQPYSRTTYGRIWNTAQNTADSLNEITYRSVEENESRNVMPALQYASRLYFRPGASKILILVQARECQGNEKFEEITSMLNAHDLTLHILEADGIKPRSMEHKPLKVYGVDQNGAFTIKHVKGSKPDAKLSNKVSVPRDQCTPAAFESRGSLFNLDHALPSTPPGADADWAPSRPGLDQRFASVWADRVASGAHPPSSKQLSCECMRDVQKQRGLLVCRRSDLNAELETLWDKPFVAPDIADDFFAAKDVSVEYSDESFV